MRGFVVALGFVVVYVVSMLTLYSIMQGGGDVAPVLQRCVSEPQPAQVVVEDSQERGELYWPPDTGIGWDRDELKCSERSVGVQWAPDEIVPVVLISFERPKSLEASVRALRNHVASPYGVWIMDMGSTSVEMQRVLTDFKNRTKWPNVRAVKHMPTISHPDELNKLIGDLILGLIDELKPSPRFFVVSDGDVRLQSAADVFDLFASILESCRQLHVVGASLSIFDVPNSWKDRQFHVKHEKGWWDRPRAFLWKGINTVAYEAWIDTTFAMYPKHFVTIPGFWWHRLNRGMRIGPPYSAQHMPWGYPEFESERLHYEKHANHNMSTLLKKEF